MSAALPVRVLATIVASFDGPCPNLGPEFRCGIYEERPRVCRIYPAEVNPFIELTPANKACPPEAWHGDKPVFMAQGKLVDAKTADIIDQSRETTCAKSPRDNGYVHCWASMPQRSRTKGT